jgi:hypothetical protein
MAWTERTANPRALLAYFDEAPGLAGVEVQRLSLLRDGPSAEIAFVPATPPDRPSKRWPAGADRCLVVLRVIGVSAVDVRRWGTGVVCDLAIEDDPAGVAVRLTGEADVRVAGAHLDVVRVEGYVHADR